MFAAIALVCDEFFVPTLEKICELLGLQEDVAGATFMAFGSSGPEHAVGVIGVFVSEVCVSLWSIISSSYKR